MQCCLCDRQICVDYMKWAIVFGILEVKHSKTVKSLHTFKMTFWRDFNWVMAVVTITFVF